MDAEHSFREGNAKRKCQGKEGPGYGDLTGCLLKTDLGDQTSLEIAGG